MEERSGFFVHPLLGEIRLPWEYGLALLCTAGYAMRGSKYHSNEQNAYYALDFDRPWQGNIEPITKILAISNGKISCIGSNPNDLMGLQVKISHGYGMVSLYAHLREIMHDIVVGRDVIQGQCLGYLGETGRADGPHLHFQLYFNGMCLEETIEAKPEPFSGYYDFKTDKWYLSNNLMIGKEGVR